MQVVFKLDTDFPYGALQSQLEQFVLTDESLRLEVVSSEITYYKLVDGLRQFELNFDSYTSTATYTGPVEDLILPESHVLNYEYIEGDNGWTPWDRLENIDALVKYSLEFPNQVVVMKVAPQGQVILEPSLVESDVIRMIQDTLNKEIRADWLYGTRFCLNAAMVDIHTVVAKIKPSVSM